MPAKPNFKSSTDKMLINVPNDQQKILVDIASKRGILSKKKLVEMLVERECTTHLNRQKKLL